MPAYKFDCLLRRENVDRYDDRVQIYTNLLDAYDQMMIFVEKHLNDPFYLEGDMRISLRDKIFREAVSNIISHREYTHGSPARLMIYKDKVVLDNPCSQHHFGKITPANLRPFSKNPVICRFMIQLGRFDQLGSGVTNIHKYLPHYTKGALPLFEETQYGFELTLPLVAELTTQQVTPEVARMVNILKGEMKRSKIMEVLDLKDEKHFREKYQQAGIAAGVIEMTIPDKPQSRNQKYRLTPQGRAFLGQKNGSDHNL